MAVVFMSGPCMACKRVFSFHPNKVPSFQGHVICESCMHMINEERKKRGNKPFAIQPGAYEPADENDINWDGKPITVYPQED